MGAGQGPGLLPEALTLPSAAAGFTPGAKELFTQQNHLALYRLPSAEMVRESSLGRLSYVTKRRPPLSHMISLFIKDTTTSEPPGLGSRRDQPPRSWGQGSALLIPLWDEQMSTGSFSDVAGSGLGKQVGWARRMGLPEGRAAQCLHDKPSGVLHRLPMARPG